MPDRSERRQFGRYPIQLPLLHTPKGPIHTPPRVGWTRNLSEGGTCVELTECLQSRMPLRLHLRTERGTIEAEGKVAWADKARLDNAGILHGVAFTPLAVAPLQALRDVLLTKGLVRPGGVRLPFEVPVTCQRKGDAGLPLGGWTHDVSRGGILLRLPQILQPDTLLEMTLHTPSGPLRAEGTITWVAPPEGRTPGGPIRHGARFTHLTWPTTQALGVLLTQSGERFS